MKRFLFAGLVLLAAVTCSLARESSTDPAAHAHRQWVAQALHEMETIKVGMTRQELLKVFTTEGGLSSRLQRIYVYRGCEYFKVTAEFKAADPDDRGVEEQPGDRITAISKPYLQVAIID